MNGYCLLILDGKKGPTYRIVFKPMLTEALKAIKQLKSESEGRVEVLRMVNGDTKPTKEDSNEFIED